MWKLPPSPPGVPPLYPWQQLLRGSLVHAQRPECPDTWPPQELLFHQKLAQAKCPELGGLLNGLLLLFHRENPEHSRWKKGAQCMGNTHKHTPAKEARSRDWGWTLSVKLALRTKLLRGQGRGRGKAQGNSPKNQGQLSSRKRLPVSSETAFPCQISHWFFRLQPPILIQTLPKFKLCPYFSHFYLPLISSFPVFARVLLWGSEAYHPYNCAYENQSGYSAHLRRRWLVNCWLWKATQSFHLRHSKSQKPEVTWLV